MNKLNVELENCYGIKKLIVEFDFTKKKVFAIYAPNGVMKSSLAQTFKDIADNVASKDRVFPTRSCVRKVIDENGINLAKESVLVIRPYDEVFGHSQKTSTLLVDSVLREEYEQLHLEIDISKTSLLKVLKDQSGSKKDLEKEISSTFTNKLFYTGEQLFGGSISIQSRQLISHLLGASCNIFLLRKRESKEK